LRHNLIINTSSASDRIIIQLSSEGFGIMVGKEITYAAKVDLEKPAAEQACLHVMILSYFDHIPLKELTIR
jgi:hypothetical protein